MPQFRLQSCIKLWPFKVISGTGDKPKIVVTYKGEEKEFTIEDISSILLSKMCGIIETYCCKSCNNNDKNWRRKKRSRTLYKKHFAQDRGLLQRRGERVYCWRDFIYVLLKDAWDC